MWKEGDMEGWFPFGKQRDIFLAATTCISLEPLSTIGHDWYLSPKGICSRSGLNMVVMPKLP